MPTFLGYEVLNQIACSVREISSRRAIVRADYGDGYADTAIVGMAGGRKAFVCHAGVWPDDPSRVSIDAASWMSYYWDFFNARLDAGNEPFVIEWRDRKWLVDLADDSVNVNRVPGPTSLYGIYTPPSIALNQRRVSGVVTNSDGSLFDPPPTVPTGLTATPVSEASIATEWNAST